MITDDGVSPPAAEPPPKPKHAGGRPKGRKDSKPRKRKEVRKSFLTERAEARVPALTVAREAARVARQVSQPPGPQNVAPAASGELQPVAPEASGLPTDILAWCRKYLAHEVTLAWRTYLAALYGLVLQPDEQECLRLICGFDAPLPSGYSEGLVVAGRRAGKSETIALVALFECLVRGAEHAKFLAPGQRGYVVVVSRTQRQALQVYRYAREVAERNPELRDLLDGKPLEQMTGGELRFKNGMSLSVLPASKSSVRGFTIVGAILDELAFVGGKDEESAEQDSEIYSAIKYGMAPPVGAPKRRLISITSPAAKYGLVYDLFSRYHGRRDAPVLVARGATQTFNPNISSDWLDGERQRDPKKYDREVLAEFADSISPWIDRTTVDDATKGRDLEPLPRLPKGQHFVGIDLAARRDSSVLVVAHLEDAVDDGPVELVEVRDPVTREARLERRVQAKGVPSLPRFVVDRVERRTPSKGQPLDLPLVIADFAAVAKSYGARDLWGDQWSAPLVASELRRHGLALREEVASQNSKARHYGRLRETFYARRASIPPHPALVRELVELQERLNPNGSLAIAAPNREGAHDDTCSALAWCHAAAMHHLRRGNQRAGASSSAWLDH